MNDDSFIILFFISGIILVKWNGYEILNHRCVHRGFLEGVS